MALAEDITRPWRQNMSRYLAETLRSAMVASQPTEAVVSMPCWASSSINEPMSTLEKAVCLDVHSIFVMQK